MITLAVIVLLTDAIMKGVVSVAGSLTTLRANRMYGC